MTQSRNRRRAALRRELKFERLECRRVLASITGQVFDDVNNNAAVDSGDTPLNGVDVQLLNSQLQVVGSARTGVNDLDSNGQIDPVAERGVFQFANLAPGDYRLRLDPTGGDIQVSPVGDLQVLLGPGQAVSGLQLGADAAEPLSQADLNSAVAAARQRWIDSGLTAQQLARIDALSYLVWNSSQNLLDRNNSLILVDADPSRGWFVDPTLDDDREFNIYEAADKLATNGIHASRYDLLTVISESMRREMAGALLSIGVDEIALGTRELTPGVAPKWWDTAELRFESGDDWFDQDWQYRLPSNTVNNGATTIADGQFELRISSPTLAANAQPNGADIRVVDRLSGEVLNHWIEDYDSAAGKATVMARTSTIDSGEQRVLDVYFGNPNALPISSWTSTVSSPVTTQNEIVTPQRSLLSDASNYDAFPSAERLHNGDIVVVYRAGSLHISSDGYLVLARSTDNGQTWNSSTVFDQPGIDDRVNIGLSQLADGTLILPFVQYDSQGPTDAFIIKSNDNGYTWTTPILVNHPFSDWVFPYGKLVERPDGAIEMPVYGAYLDGSRDVSTLQSIDQGVTWTLRSTVDSRQSGSGFGEMSVLPLAGSGYLAVYRESNQIYQRKSTDNGLTWGVKTLLFDGVSPELTRLSSGEILLCVGDRNGTQGVRCHISVNEGVSWSSGVMVATANNRFVQDGGYPASVQLPDGNILTAFYYDSGNRRLNIDQVIYSPSFVTGIATSSVSDFVYDGIENGNLTNWNETPGTVTVSVERPHLGSYSVKVVDSTDDQPSDATRQIYFDSTAVGGTSFWVNLDSQSPAGAALWLGGATTSERKFELKFGADEAVQYRDQNGLLQPLANNVTLDEWHKFTIYFNTTTGIAVLQIDGQSVGAFTARQLGGGVTHFGVGSISDVGAGNSVYLDDVYTHAASNINLAAIQDPQQEAETSQAVFRLEGTGADNDMKFLAGFLQHQVEVDGENYFVHADIASRYEIDGREGGDTLLFVGLPTQETVALEPHLGTISGENLSVNVMAMEEITVDGGGGNDVAELRDSIGDDEFWGRPTYAYVRGSGFINEVRAFGRVNALAEQGNDLARIFGSAESDTFYGRQAYSYMFNDNYLNYAEGYDHVIGYSNGGEDTAYLFDSSGADRFVGRETYSYLEGNGFLNEVRDFGRVFGHATVGQDVAELYDSPFDDRFIAREDYSYLEGNGFLNQVDGFKRVSAFAYRGGNDEARLFDTPANDSFVGRHTNAYLTNGATLNQAYNFDSVQAIANRGGVDTAQLFASPAVDLYVARPTYAYMQGPGFVNQANQFEQVHGKAGGSGDRARLYGSAGDDALTATLTTTTMSGPGYSYRAEMFPNVRSYGGGSVAGDTAQFIGSDVAEVFYSRRTYDYLVGGVFVVQVDGFTQVDALGGSGDQAFFFEALDADFLLASLSTATLQRTGKAAGATGFDEVTAVTLPGQEPQSSVDSIDFVLNQIGNWNEF